jgi:hypothetical protein
VDKGDLLDEDDDPVFESDGFHGLVFAWPWLCRPIFLGQSARHLH